ncbi:MAG: hypothetical protein MZV49_02225 [Rhodopseudomonas palustris]|nr:hypothetical protein [Rhodopseudomonas palustris]
MADADDLGRAAAEANRAARKTYMPTSLRPRRNSNGLSRAWRTATETEPSYGYGAEPDDMARYQPGARPQADQPPPSKRVRASVSDQGADRRRRTADADRRCVPVGTCAPTSTCAACSARSPPWSKPPRTLRSTSRPKITDRVGQPSSMDQIAAVAQRVVLYDEDPSDPKGKQYVGSVVWRTEPIKGAGASPAISPCAPISKFRNVIQDDDVVPPQYRPRRCRRAIPWN